MFNVNANDMSYMRSGYEEYVRDSRLTVCLRSKRENVIRYTESLPQ